MQASSGTRVWLAQKRIRESTALREEGVAGDLVLKVLECEEDSSQVGILKCKVLFGCLQAESVCHLTQTAYSDDGHASYFVEASRFLASHHLSSPAYC